MPIYLGRNVSVISSDKSRVSPHLLSCHSSSSLWQFVSVAGSRANGCKGFFLTKSAHSSSLFSPTSFYICFHVTRVGLSAIAELPSSSLRLPLRHSGVFGSL